MDIIKRMEGFGIIPVIKIEDLANALPLAKALIDGGLPVAEITFRTKCARQAIETITNHYPEMQVGAGTILTIEQAGAAMDSGAAFIVAPGINPRVVEYCLNRKMSVIPGTITPSEIEMAIEFGLEVVKFFPAEQAGGLPMIKALSAPYENMRFMPTGGINEKNLAEYLRFPKVIACGGSFMVSEKLIAQRDWAEITRLTINAMNFVREVRK